MIQKIIKISTNKVLFLPAIIFVFLFSYLSIKSQTKGLSTGAEQSLQEDMKLNNSEKNPTEMQPVGNIVIPEYYYIRPGDMLSVQILNISGNPQIIVVSPECKDPLPRIGEIDLKNKTLAESISLIKSKYKERNPDGEIYVSLSQPGTVLVTFTGNLKLPGTYALPASYRVSTAIKSLDQYTNLKQLSPDEISEQIRQNSEKNQNGKIFYSGGISNLKSYIRRNIIIKRSLGESRLLDLDKADVLDSIADDPFIREGDEIYIPFEPQEYQTISIGGPVANPGTFAYRSGDHSSLLIKLGKGFREAADLNHIYLYNPDAPAPIQITLDSYMNIIGEDYELQPDSRIIVGQKPIQMKNKNGFVSVQGCVKFPNVYMIKNNETHLKDIIEIAGGLTDKAYLPNAYVMRYEYRSYNEIEKRREYDQKLRNSTLTLQDTLRFALDELNKNSLVSCDFVQLFEKGSEKSNIKLLDGDVIVIPEMSLSVYVYGQVKNPGFVPFEKDKTMDWYIEQAGGFSESADKSRSRIIRGLNKVWIKGDSKNLVYAGDEIYVPRPEDLPPGLELQNYAVIAGILASAAALMNFILYLFTKK